MSAFTDIGIDVDYCLTKRNFYQKEESFSKADIRNLDKETLKTGEEDDYYSFSDKFFYISNENLSETTNSKNNEIRLKSMKETTKAFEYQNNEESKIVMAINETEIELLKDDIEMAQLYNQWGELIIVIL